MPEALTAEHLLSLLLVFVRTSAMLLVAPLFGHRAIPVLHRIGLALALALIVSPGMPARRPGTLLALIMTLAGEALVGLAIGGVAAFIVASVHAAGELLGFQMGLTVASAWDPGLGQQISPLTRLYDTLALLLFLSINGHHVLLGSLAASLRTLPTGALVVTAADGMVQLGARVLSAGLEIAAPVTGVLLAANVLLALSARVAPQMNVFGVGVPITLALGLFAALDTLPHVTSVVTRLATDLAADLGRVFGGARGV